jgi:hypothetical protein
LVTVYSHWQLALAKAKMADSLSLLSRNSTTMSLFIQNSTETIPRLDAPQQASHRLPRALLSVSREEFYGQDENHQPLQLTVRDGTTGEEVKLPDDLTGSVFFIATAGCIASPKVSSNASSDNQIEDDDYVVLPSKDGWTPLLNGDGMVYRLDFQDGKAQLTTRLVKTPSYYADKILHDNPKKYPHLTPFRNFGIARLASQLGACNQVNTAFLPLKFPKQNHQRLLATWDMGRPYEINPYSLKVVAPVGLNKDWHEMLKMPKPVPFRLVMNSAHPAFDFDQGKMFTLNVTKSLNTLLSVSRLFPNAFKIITAKLPKYSIWRKLLRLFTRLLTPLVEFFLGLLELLGLGGDSGVYLIRWDEKGDILRWKVVLPSGRPVKIRQTTHQIGLTKNYIILADTAFKIVIGNVLPSLQNFIQDYKVKASSKGDFEEKILSWLRFHRQYLTFPLLPYTKLYIVKRNQLDKVKPGDSVKALPVKLKREIAHFLVDYDDKDGKITLHAALNCATDFAEFIRSDDISAYKDAQGYRSLKDVAGVFVDAMAVNRPAIYLINGESGKTEKEELLSLDQSRKHTWALGLYAYRDEQPTQQFEDIYWSSFGAWKDTLPKFIYDLYNTYKYNTKHDLEDVLQRTKQGVPAMLSRVHIDRTKAEVNKPMLSIADSFEFPPGDFANSPQFIPRGENGSTEGYLVCVVTHSDHFFSAQGNGSDTGENWSNKNEIWIFDANDLRKGGKEPLYKLSHSKLNFGFTLHTTWLPTLKSQPEITYNVREDFDWLVSKAAKSYPGEIAQEIQALFNEVYEQVERDRDTVD